MHAVNGDPGMMIQKSIQSSAPLLSTGHRARDDWSLLATTGKLSPRRDHVEASELLRFVRVCRLEIFAGSRVFMAQGKQPERGQGAGGNGEQSPHGEPKSSTAMGNQRRARAAC